MSKFNLLLINKIFCIVIVSLVISGCYKSEFTSPLYHPNKPEDLLYVQLENDFSLMINQSAIIESENLELKLLEVKNDSRCFSETQCIWPGLVEIIVNIKKNNQDIELNMIDKEENNNPKRKVFDNYLVELKEVTPYPQKNQTIETKDYSATFKVFRE